MACRRRRPASARASLPLPAAPEARRSAPRGGRGVAGERWGAPGSLHRQYPGRRPSWQRRVRGRVFPPSAVAWLAGVGCAAPLRTLTPLRVRAVRSPPVPHALRHGRAGSTARGPGALVCAQHGLARHTRRWCGPVRRPRGVCHVVAQSRGGPTGGCWCQPVRYP